MTQEQFEFFGKIALYMLGFQGITMALVAAIAIQVTKIANNK
jgi:hypothetical protein